MRTRSRSILLAATVTALVMAAPAEARQRPITVKLSKPGYTIIALAPDGKAVSARARGTTKLVPAARTVTLQLVDRRGRYAGPVVVGLAGRKAIVGVRAGAKLGRVRIRRGYATLARRPSPAAIDKRRRAVARRGAPIGSRVFGRVRSTGRGSAGRGIDQDLDGVPGAFDVDDDGDLILDNFERTARTSGLSVATAAQAPPPAGPQPPSGPPLAPSPAPAGPQPGGTAFRLFSNLKLNIAESVNANANGVTDGQVDRALSSMATLAIQVPTGDSVELECPGLSYCSAGGTGTTLEGERKFPDAVDSDGDGLGTVERGPTGDFQLRPGASSSQIGSGDVLIEHISNKAAVTQLPGILNYVFSTTPALTSYSTAAASGSISYPVAVGGVGTPASPIAVPASGDAVATLTFWRPQRRAIPGSGEGQGWVDIGRLSYTADVPNGPSGGPGSPGSPGPGNCRGSSYATADPNLTVTGDGVGDSLGDRPADPANTLSFSIDLTACLAASGISWAPGQQLAVDIQARSQDGDNAAQKIWFVRR